MGYVSRLFLKFFLGTALFQSLTFAQIAGIVLKDAATEKSYQSHLVEFNGVKGLVGELMSDLKNSQETHLKLKVLNPSDPKSKGKEIKISKNDLKAGNPIYILMKHESLESLSQEYSLRVSKIESLTKQRNAAKKDSQEWLRLELSIVSNRDSLVSWLTGNLFAAAAIKAKKDLEAERKILGDSTFEWEKGSLANVQTQIQTPEKLVSTSTKLTGNSAKFEIVESRHFRIIYLQEFNDSNARVLKRDEAIELLGVAESALSFFRREVVFRFLRDGIKDPFADKEVFVEFFFGPAGENNALYGDFFEQYYGQNWGPQKSEKIALSGTRFFKGGSKGIDTYIFYSKLQNGADLKGKILHSLGHAFSNSFYNEDRFENSPQPWLEEAVAYWLSFEMSGNNSETCVSFEKQLYAKQKGKANNLELIKGFRNTLSLLAAESKTSVSQLLIKKLIDLEDHDIAKAFHLYSYILNSLGIEGEEWLKQTCSKQNRRSLQNSQNNGSSSTTIDLDIEGKLRSKTEELLAIKFAKFKSGQDIFAVINEELVKSIK